MTHKAVLMGNIGAVNRVFSSGRREQVEVVTQLHPQVIDQAAIEADPSVLQGVQVIFSTWGMPRLGEAALRYCDQLEAMFYAAGSVRPFAEPLMERGVLVTSAWKMNGLPVAEFTLAQILLSNKGAFRNMSDCATPQGRMTAYCGDGNYQATVALLGAGAIGRRLIELLKPFDLKVLVFDPFLTEERAKQLGVEKVTLDEAFTRGDVVSNHIANIPETVGVLQGVLFEKMKDHATFINTGRGATVKQAEMVDVLRRRPTLTALLDVTSPEPLPADSPLYQLPNVRLTSHIAGSIGSEVLRLADHAIRSYQDWAAGRPVADVVTLDMYAHMA